ncbi:hypothetical protein GALMADRAFT_906263 [Galerina marginata CBS 339.88]|uniref:Uncharacterized protein n=1 Tax=Galerina marginata (strain CBS 339.88) TaxID=685588 RepID=A0A067STM0_GALM3|nr:hypothetical protein GALMADRAFT_906263 [Galerina marginata CBS 339.88]
MSFASSSSSMNPPHRDNHYQSSTLPDRPIDPSLWTPSQCVDDISDRFRLSAEQRHDLHEALRIGSEATPKDMLLRVSAQAQMLEMRNEVFQMRTGMLEIKDEMSKLSNMMATMIRKDDGTESVLKDVRGILTKWDLSPSQKTNMIAVTKDFVCSATITSYETIDTAVKEELKANAKRYGFDDVFDKPDRVSVIKKEVGSQCRSIKNQYRVHILNSVDDKPASLAATVQLLYRKYKLEENLSLVASAQFTARVALLRRFARENLNCLRVESPATDLNETDLAYARKRQRTEEEPGSIPRRGRVSKENSFWHCFDKFLLEKLMQFGDDFESAKWKEYIAETLILDGVPQHTPSPL